MCSTIAGCVGCIIGLSIIAFRFFIFMLPAQVSSLLYSDTDDYYDSSINNFNDECVTPIQHEMNIIKPPHLELTILMLMPIVGCILTCCCGCCAAVEDIQDKVLLLTAGTTSLELGLSIAAIFHICAYLFSLKNVFTDNGMSDCLSYEQWGSTIWWMEIAFGFSIAVLVVAVCAVLIWRWQSTETDTRKYSPPKHQHTSTSQPVTVEMRVQKRTNPLPQRKDSLSENTKRKVMSTVFSAALIEALGFKLATLSNKNSILYALRNTHCSGATALRDAVGGGVQMMLELKGILDKFKHSIIGHKFIHIVLTDGEDNSSNIAMEELAAVFMLMGIAFGDHFGKTFFVGIDLENKAKNEFESIAQLGGNAAESFNCNEVSMTDVFERIRINIGLRRRVGIITDGSDALFMKEDRLFVSAEREKFLVLFTLDKSGSMRGQRWSKLQQAISSFLDELDGGDIVGVVLFNDKVQRLEV